MDYHDKWMSFFDDFADHLKKDPALYEEVGRAGFRSQKRKGKEKIMLIARVKMRMAIVCYTAPDFLARLDMQPLAGLPEVDQIFYDLLSRMRKVLSETSPAFDVNCSAEVTTLAIMHQTQYLAEKQQDDALL